MNINEGHVAVVVKGSSISELHRAALDYAKKGIPIFPLVANGKTPIVKWGAEATTDPSIINGWWQQNPNFNIGLVTGVRSKITVVDFDTAEAWSNAQTKGLPDAPLVKTGRGYHLYCKYLDGTRNFQKRADLPGIDLRSEGGYVVAPPSVHENGKVYTWIEGNELDSMPLPLMPEWLLAKTPEIGRAHV